MGSKGAPEILFKLIGGAWMGSSKAKCLGVSLTRDGDGGAGVSLFKLE